MDAQFMGSLTDAQGRQLVAVRQLDSAVTPDLGITVQCARILEVLGTKTLQLRLVTSRPIPAGTVIFSSAQLLGDIVHSQNLYDVTNGFVLNAGPAYIKTVYELPANTFIYNWPLY